MKWMIRFKMLLLFSIGTCLSFFMYAAEHTTATNEDSTKSVEETSQEQVVKKTGTQPLELGVPTPIHKVVVEPSDSIAVSQPALSVKPKAGVVSTVPSTSVPLESQVSLQTAPAESGVKTPAVQTETKPVMHVPAGFVKEPGAEEAPVINPEKQSEKEEVVKTVIPTEQKEVVTTEKAQEVVEQQQKEIKQPSPKPSTMLDTIDIEEGGNWLIKRQIFEDTFKLLDEMDQVNTKIRDMRMTFFQLRNDIDKEIALFIKDMGYDLGKLDQMATTLLLVMEEEKKQEGALNQEERSVVFSAQDLEKKIKVIQSAGQEILNLENKIDSEILKSLEDRINESNGYRQQGWKNLQAIKKMLSDEKAQNLYNKTKALYDTLTDVLSWLQSKLLPYLRQTIQTIKNDMNIVKSHIQELQQQGFDVQKEVDALSKKEQAEQQKEINDEVQEAIAQEQEAKAQQSFFARLKTIAWYPIQLVQDGISWLMSFFSTTQTVVSEK